MKRLLFLFAISLSFIFCSSAQSASYKIEVQIDGLSDTTILLGYHFGAKKYVADTAMVDSNGHAIFSGDSLLNGGIYFVLLPEKQYFEMLIGDNQEFGVRVTRGDLLNTLQFTGSDENTQFANYQRFMVDMQEQNVALSEKIKAAADDEALKAELKKQFAALNSKVQDNWDRIVQDNKGSLFAKIINSMRPVNIPEFTIPDDVAKPDSVRWAMSYNYNRKHYFDNIDITDNRLIRTPILEQRINNYFDNVILPHPDSVIAAAIMLIDIAKADKLMFQYVLQHLSNKFQTSERMGMDGVFAIIAERYYLSGDAWWVDQKFLDRVKERVDIIKPVMIGVIAPDLMLPDQHMRYVKLSDIKSKITVLYFWDVDCSHCKKVTPEVKKLYQKYKSKGLEVLGIYTQGDQPKWMDYIKERELDWINVWYPNIGTDFRKLYDITATPVIYVLDANKRIIAKRISHESLAQILEQELGS